MAQIETFEGLPIVDTGGRYLISALDAKKISFPNDGADFGNSGDQLRSLGNGGVEWAAPGMPTYEQTEQAISDWLNAHPEATTTVADGAITDAKLNDALKRGLVYGFDTVTDPNNGMKFADNLVAGMICHTNGFHALGDGGAAWYKISDTGTANEMDVIACGELFANLIIIGDSVTPEMFGAIETTDSSPIFNHICSQYENITAKCNGQYTLNSLVNITKSNIKLAGSGKFTTNGNSAFILAFGVSDIAFDGVSIDVPLSAYPEPSNQALCIGCAGEATTYRNEGVKNVIIENCTFNGGMFNISFSSITNVLIQNNVFNDVWVNTNYNAGGYNVLLQSCYDIRIENNTFENCPHGRHNVYVSVDQSKTENIQCENVSIVNNLFDNGEQLYASLSTPFIMTRASIGTVIKNNIFKNGVGLEVSAEDEAIDGLIIADNVFDKMVYRGSAASETKTTISVNGTSTYSVTGEISGNVETESNIYAAFIIANYFSGLIVDNVCKATRNIVITASEVTIDNFITRRQSSLIRFQKPSTAETYVYKHCFIGNLRTINANGWGGTAFEFETGVTCPLETFDKKYMQWRIINNALDNIRRYLLPCQVTHGTTGQYDITLPWCSNTNMLIDAVFTGYNFGLTRRNASVGVVNITVFDLNTQSATDGAQFIFKPILASGAGAED